MKKQLKKNAASSRIELQSIHLGSSGRITELPGLMITFFGHPFPLLRMNAPKPLPEKLQPTITAFIALRTFVTQAMSPVCTQCGIVSHKRAVCGSCRTKNHREKKRKALQTAQETIKALETKLIQSEQVDNEIDPPSNPIPFPFQKNLQLGQENKRLAGTLREFRLRKPRYEDLVSELFWDIFTLYCDRMRCFAAWLSWGSLS